MQAFYNVDGEVISTYLWSDLMNGNDFRKVIEVQKFKNDRLCKPFKKNISKDNNGVFFYWNNKKVYVNDFNYMTVDEMVEYIKKEKEDRTAWFDDKLLATIMKDTNNVGILFDLPIYETIVEPLGIAFTGRKTAKTLCIPTEKRYKKDSWHYKITLEAFNEEHRKIIAYDNLYFSDFSSMILSGDAELVSKNKFLDEQVKLKNRKISSNEKILNFFKKKKEKEIIYW